MIQPSKLLQYLGVVRIAFQDPPVGCLCRIKLETVRTIRGFGRGVTHVLLLLVNMTNLKPDILFRQGPRRIVDNVFEALRRSAEDGA